MDNQIEDANINGVESYRVEPEEDGEGEWHVITFSNGWQRHILTRHPTIEVEPQKQ